MVPQKVRIVFRFIFIVLFSTINLGTIWSDSHKIIVTITDVRNSNGRIQLQMYKDQTSFAKEDPWKLFLVSKENMENNSITYTINDIPSGIYGIAVLDDENKNAEMDFSFFKPIEGFGFSNYYHSAWSKPKFENFKFNLNMDRKINVKVRYV